MKKLIIQVVIDEEKGKVGSVIKREGFSQMSSFEVIGILQNLIIQETKKMEVSQRLRFSNQDGEE